jgi:chemotaxis protein MotB
MAKKKREEAHGGHGWFVTFADLMALLLAFFVMLVAFSTQDKDKLKVVAGSMRDAFGVQPDSRYAGVLETDGVPLKGKLKNTANVSPDQASNTPSPDEGGLTLSDGAKTKAEREFALASASLRQALQDMPELTEVSKNVIFEETKDGLNMELTDQDGRSMFAEGSKVPYDRTRLLIQRLAAPLRATPLRISIAGHTSAGVVPGRADYNAFDLSSDRANAVRQILEREGVPTSQIYSVSGRADSQPLFPDDATLSANRRVTITLMREAPPLPPGLKP